ncbi:WG repeat-containing protein [Flavobacteriaceae bacterium 3-367]|uniref:WG repeat-containing protein n=1 Tax=Eudoraea algarum TaxID=3417568 RepID=UPI0032814FBC
MKTLCTALLFFFFGLLMVYPQSSLSKRFSYIGAPNSEGYRVVGKYKTVTAPTGGGYTNYSTGTRYTSYSTDGIGWRYGVVNSKGNLVIGLRFESILLLGNEAHAKKRNTTRIINLKKEKDPREKFYVKYDYIGNFWQGLALVEKNGKYGFIDEQGREAIPAVYDSLPGYSTTYIPAKKGGLWGFITTNNEVAVDFQYEETKLLNGYFLEKLGGKWAFIDPSGKHHSKFEYDAILGQRDMPVRVKKGDKWGLVDFGQQGKTILPGIYDNISRFSDRYAWAAWTIDVNSNSNRYVGKPELSMAKVEKDGKQGYVDINGQPIVPVKFQYIEACEMSDLIAAKVDGKGGYINNKGETRVPFEYDSVSCSGWVGSGFFAIHKGLRGRVKTEKGFAPLEKSDEHYITDDFKSQRSYDRMDTFEYSFGGVSYAKVYIDNKVGAIDRAGNEIVPPMYDEVGKNEMITTSPADQGYSYYVIPQGARMFIPIKSNGFWGVVNDKNEMVIEPQYEAVELFNIGSNTSKSVYLLFVEKEKKGVVDMKGNIIIKPIYDDVKIGIGNKPFEDVDAAAVKKDGKWGFINKNGEAILPFQYQNASNFEKESYGKHRIKARVTYKNKTFYIDLKGKRVR